MQFQLETCEVIINEGLELLKNHWAEIAHYKDIPLNIDVERYLAADKLGHMKAFTARDEKGVLIGYAVFFIKESIHHKDSVQAVQDVLYIDPKFRGRGAKFIFWCDDQLKDMGVQVVYHHVNANNNWGKVLERRNYELVDLIYARRLDNG